MTNWLSSKLISRKRGIPESTLRIWRSLGYIVSSTVDNEVMLDDDSLARFLDIYKTKELSAGYLEKIIQEKELEREVLLSRFDDELFLMKTHKKYQQLFHILIQELGQMIADVRLREIFLAISSGEPISRVAVRYEMTYDKTLATYQSILNNLSKYKGRIAALANRGPDSLFSKYSVDTILSMPLADIIHFHTYVILHREAQISTVRELLRYTSKNGWKSLKKLYGMGNITYSRMISALQNVELIVVGGDGSIELSPELVALAL